MGESINLGGTGRYLSHLVSEHSKHKYESWMDCLREGYPCSVSAIDILDITSSGDIQQWLATAMTSTLSTELSGTDLIDGTRLIIFDSGNRKYVQDQAGVMYDVDPGFFRAIIMNVDRHGRYDVVNHRVPEFLAGGQPQYLDLGYGWAGVIIRSNDNCNIVLVSASYLDGPSSEFGTKRYPGRNIYLDCDILSEKYLRSLRKRDKSFFAEAQKDPLLLLLPILDIHATYLYERLIYADQCFRRGRTSPQEKLDLIEKAWDALRMMRHDGMGPLNCIQQYDNDHNNGRTHHSEEYKNLAKRFECIERQICLTETLARDYLQHHIGLFSLDESRASIKQSKVALEESRRTKLSK
ncbi:hypothetical protein F5Y00DRAFT_272768 [Daldinia vernicosa]|uniref:uncharacterized protein n=1 Tax=Daldinia vernicosa TaxID=114800 RepID=UPI002007F247|nr:uncharacterized protein F5Y00DRAFT_272768 [Daldinia vernicosa]KAI0845573.1 hypothetical protein F5Y00DRAFT_272768 [Daldinia vernicosa]